MTKKNLIRRHTVTSFFLADAHVVEQDFIQFKIKNLVSYKSTQVDLGFIRHPQVVNEIIVSFIFPSFIQC